MLLAPSPLLSQLDADGQHFSTPTWVLPEDERESDDLKCDSNCVLCSREKWCHMTQEERDDSSKIDENIAFGQLG